MGNKKIFYIQTVFKPIVIRYLLYIFATICTATIDFMADDLAELITMYNNNNNNIEVYSNVDFNE